MTATISMMRPRNPHSQVPSVLYLVPIYQAFLTLKGAFCNMHFFEESVSVMLLTLTEPM